MRSICAHFLKCTAWPCRNRRSMARIWRGDRQLGGDVGFGSAGEPVATETPSAATLAVVTVAGLLLDYLSSANKKAAMNALDLFAGSFDVLLAKQC